jgi:hypothetical protein
MAINDRQFEQLKVLLETSSESVDKAKVAFEKLQTIKKSYDSLSSAKVTEIKVKEIGGKEFSLSTSTFNLNNIVSKVKDDLEAKYVDLFKIVANSLNKRVVTEDDKNKK